MTDSEDRKLDQLLENMDLLRKETGQQFAGLQKTGDARFEAVTKQIDTVAEHLALADERVTKLETSVVHLGENVESLLEEAKKLDVITRQLDLTLDRFDRQNARIETLERKTARLPTPSPK